MLEQLELPGTLDHQCEEGVVLNVSTGCTIVILEVRHLELVRHASRLGTPRCLCPRLEICNDVLQDLPLGALA